MSLQRLNSKIAAAVALGVALLYLVLSVATGHSATAEPPPDLRPKGAALDVWKTLAMLVEHPGQVAVVDVRPAERFELYRLPASTNAPGAGAAQVLGQAPGKHFVVVVGDKDAETVKLLGEMAKRKPRAALYYLAGGARQWYLALELPVPLFSSKPAPFGYASSLARVKAWLKDPAAVDKQLLTQAIGRLATVGFTPNLLAGKKKAAASGKKKKIAGGCG